MRGREIRLAGRGIEEDMEMPVLALSDILGRVDMIVIAPPSAPIARIAIRIMRPFLDVRGAVERLGHRVAAARRHRFERSKGKRRRVVHRLQRRTGRRVETYREGPHGFFAREEEAGAHGFALRPDGAQGFDFAAAGAQGFAGLAEGAQGLALLRAGAHGLALRAAGAQGFALLPDGAHGFALLPDGAQGFEPRAEGAHGFALRREGPQGLPGAQGLRACATSTRSAARTAGAAAVTASAAATAESLRARRARSIEDDIRGCFPGLR